MTTATLKATKVFSYLRPEEIDILSNYASTEQYKAGAIVYRKGQLVGSTSIRHGY
jgi:hypothetical protein